MVKRDYYDLFGIERSASIEEIKKAYRRLAHQYHPDKNPENPAAEEHFKDISAAYEVLQDVQKRAAYDRFGPAMRQGRAEGRRTSGAPFSGGESFDDVFNEILADFFGGSRQRRKKTKGADLRYNLEISLEEAAAGVDQGIKVPRNSVCPHCRGGRCSPGTAPMTCPECRGHGSTHLQRGFFIVESPCERCGGEGQIILRPCPQCAGKGRVKATRTVSFRVPPGVDHGARLRLSGEGEAGQGGAPPGDLYVVIGIKKHPVFTRSGNELICEIPLTLLQAAAGGEIEVPTLEGKVHLKIDAGTPSGKVFICKGKGMPVLNRTTRGDLHVRVRVVIPSKLSKRQRELLEEFERLSKEGGK